MYQRGSHLSCMPRERQRTVRSSAGKAPALGIEWATIAAIRQSRSFGGPGEPARTRTISFETKMSHIDATRTRSHIRKATASHTSWTCATGKKMFSSKKYATHRSNERCRLGSSWKCQPQVLADSVQSKRCCLHLVTPDAAVHDAPWHPVRHVRAPKRKVPRVFHMCGIISLERRGTAALRQGHSRRGRCLSVLPSPPPRRTGSAGWTFAVYLVDSVWGSSLPRSPVHSGDTPCKSPNCDVVSRYCRELTRGIRRDFLSMESLGSRRQY